MSLQYHVVRRTDLRKDAPEGAVLYYGQVRAGEHVTLSELSESISALSTASEGDVSCVLEGLVMIMRRQLLNGSIIQLGDLGNFRMVAGSPGVEKEADFHTSMFKNGKIVFYPGSTLRDLTTKVRYEKIKFIEREDECDLPHAV